MREGFIRLCKVGVVGLGIVSAACEGPVSLSGPLCKSPSKTSTSDADKVRRLARYMAIDGVASGEAASLAEKIRGCSANSLVAANLMSDAYNPEDVDARELTTDATMRYIDWTFSGTTSSAEVQ